MRYVSAYMLASMATSKGHGHHEHVVTVADIENILGSVGVDCDKNMAETVVNKLAGKSLEQLIAQGVTNLCSVSASAGTAAPAPVSGPSGDAPAAVAKPVEEKKEEKEESDDDMGFGLFD